MKANATSTNAAAADSGSHGRLVTIGTIFSHQGVDVSDHHGTMRVGAFEPSQYAELVRLHVAGWSDARIADALGGCDRSTVTRTRKRPVLVEMIGRKGRAVELCARVSTCR
jgi:Homeodomain-like domain